MYNGLWDDENIHVSIFVSETATEPMSVCVWKVARFAKRLEGSRRREEAPKAPRDITLGGAGGRKMVPLLSVEFYSGFILRARQSCAGLLI